MSFKEKCVVKKKKERKRSAPVMRMRVCAYIMRRRIMCVSAYCAYCAYYAYFAYVCAGGDAFVRAEKTKISTIFHFVARL